MEKTHGRGIRPERRAAVDGLLHKLVAGGMNG